MRYRVGCLYHMILDTSTWQNEPYVKEFLIMYQGINAVKVVASTRTKNTEVARINRATWNIMQKVYTVTKVPIGNLPLYISLPTKMPLWEKLCKQI
jgi:hypothetical protein